MDVNRAAVTTAESMVAGLDDRAAAGEELLVATAWALAGQLELDPLVEPVAVILSEFDEAKRITALTLGALAKLSGVGLVAVCEGPRSWFAAALLGADEIHRNDEDRALDLSAEVVPALTHHRSLQDQLEEIALAVGRLVAGTP